MGFCDGSLVKNQPAMQEIHALSLGWEDPLEKRMPTHSVSLPGEFHEQRSLTGCISCYEESDMTEQLTHTLYVHTYMYIYLYIYALCVCVCVI